MSQQGDVEYKLITEANEELPNSREYTGRGLAQYPNGDSFEGTYEKGVREGRGIYRYKDGDKYEGEWVANMKHGVGKQSYKDGVYNGFWENGRRHGEGVFTYTNGDIYSGWWKFGSKEGTGTYTFKETGMKLYGDWVAGSIVKGKWIYPNGMFYEGAFDKNKPAGEGKWVFVNEN